MNENKTKKHLEKEKGVEPVAKWAKEAVDTENKAADRTRLTESLILLGFVLGIFFWVLEALIHTFIFHQGHFINELFPSDPHEIWMRLLITLLFILFGFYAQYIVNIRKRAEKATKLAYLELDQIFNTAADGMRLVDKNFTTLRINQTLSDLLGMRKDEAVNMKCYETFSGSFCHTADCPLTRVLEGEERVECDVEKERRDGKKIPCIVTATPFKGSNGELIGIIEDFKDVTERKKAQEELTHRAEELARSNAELQQFAYVASHDLQEPLRMVASYVQLLAKRYKGKLDADADDFIDFAVNGAKRMQTLINDLLAFSRVGTRGKNFSPSDCTAVLNQALANLEMIIKESNATITHHELPVIMADESQLVQLFQNLISNSIKFHGKESPHIHISAVLKSDQWVFSVRDNGIGIDPQFADRIFVIFQRLHSRDESSGTGIGLAICKKIVERHGGRIWVESGPGKGATFYFTIPMRKIRDMESVIK